MEGKSVTFWGCSSAASPSLCGPRATHQSPPLYLLFCVCVCLSVSLSVNQSVSQSVLHYIENRVPFQSHPLLHCLSLNSTLASSLRLSVSLSGPLFSSFILWYSVCRSSRRRRCVWVVCFRAFSFFILSHTFWSSTLRAACSPGCKVDHLDYPQWAICITDDSQ